MYRNFYCMFLEAIFLLWIQKGRRAEIFLLIFLEISTLFWIDSSKKNNNFGDIETNSGPLCEKIGVLHTLHFRSKYSC